MPQYQNATFYQYINTRRRAEKREKNQETKGMCRFYSILIENAQKNPSQNQNSMINMKTYLNNSNIYLFK